MEYSNEFGTFLGCSEAVGAVLECSDEFGAALECSEDDGVVLECSDDVVRIVLQCSDDVGTEEDSLGEVREGASLTEDRLALLSCWGMSLQAVVVREGFWMMLLGTVSLLGVLQFLWRGDVSLKQRRKLL